MMTRKMNVCLCAVGLPVLAWCAPSPLAGRVAADFIGAKAAAFRHYAVPAMSEQQRLSDAYPTDGYPGADVDIVLARDEYEDGSFLVWPTRDLGKVQLALTPFKNEKGQVFPAADLDLRVVKVWYQNRNAWFSYFGDTGLKLVPELLLHDEDLVRVDEKKVSNYARLIDAKGKRSEVWLNPPHEMKRRELTAPWIKMERFEPMRGDFKDAETLQPVLLKAKAFRNFFLTVHAQKGTPAGLYRGAVTLTSAKGEALGEIPVAIRVLDFVLPQPKCWGRPEKDFLVSFYECASIGSLADLNGGDIAKAKRQLVNVFRDQVAHNHVIHWMNGNMSNNSRFTFEAMKEGGKRMDIHLSCFGPQYGDRDAATRPQRIADELDRLIGNHNSYIGHGDEPGAKWLAEQRPVYEAYQKAGLKFIIAGGDQVFKMAGYLYDWHNVAQDPTNGKSPALWNSLQNDNHVAWYANQHTGSENPAFARRQNGLGAWLAGYTALCNYETALGPWNDLSTTYRPMVFAYACGDGLVDTLQWQGFREGVDDIRYATLLSDYARKAQASKDLATRYLGGQAMQYLTSLEIKRCDLELARAEIIARIAKLAPLVTPYVEKSSVVIDTQAAKAGAARAEVNLKRDLAEAEAKLKSAKTPKEVKEAHLGIAAVYKRYFRFVEAGDYLVKAGFPEEAARYSWTGTYYECMPEKQEAAQLAVLKAHTDQGGSFGRADAFYGLLPKHPELIKTHYESVLFANIRPMDTNAWQRAVRDVFTRLGRYRLYMAGQQFAASVSLYERTLPLAKKWGVVVPALAACNVYEAYVHLGNDRGAEQVAKEGLKDEKAKPNERAFLTLGVAFAKCHGDEKGALALANKASAGLADIANADRVAAIQLLGSVLYGARREGAVRGLEAYRKSLYKPTPKKRYVVHFSETPITGLADMVRVEAEGSAYDRSYGGSLEFLTTDVTSGNRGDVGSSKDRIAPPVMKVVADEQGLHILVTAKDPKAKEIELGTVGDCSFEGYIAPGANTPYYCTMAEARERYCKVFNTSYVAPGFDRLENEDFGNKFKFDRVYREGEIVCYFFYSWQTWATRIPKNGSVWDYENMYWYRGGNFCWNGTESIHGRSTWGELEFALTDAQRAKILRPVLARTYAAYKGEKYVGGLTALGHWKDAVLGDPDFYTHSVAPYEAELDAYGALLSGRASDATVLWLEANVLPKWKNIYFETARRRTRHLRDGLCR